MASLNRDTAHANDGALEKIFDQQKVAAQREYQKASAELAQQASIVVRDYANSQRKTLQEQIKSANDEEKAAIQEKIKDLNFQERVINVLIGAVSGMGATALTKETLSAAAEEMRNITIENSSRFKGITDGTTTLSNMSGDSEGIRGDGIKGGGTRVDLDNICGPDNSRCKTKYENGKEVLALDADGRVQFDAQKVGMSLSDYLDSSEGQKASGATGGIQGWKGTLFGKPYTPGSWQDNLIESFGGTHDFIGGQITGLYDEQGNTTRGRSTVQKYVHETWSSTGAIVVSTPFAMAELLPTEVWKAIAVLLRDAK